MASADKKSHIMEYGANLVGSRIRLWWPTACRFHDCVIDSFDSADGMHEVLYDDDVYEIVNLKWVKWEFIEDESASDLEEGSDSPSSDASADISTNVNKSSMPTKKRKNPPFNSTLASQKRKEVTTHKPSPSSPHQESINPNPPSDPLSAGVLQSLSSKSYSDDKARKLIDDMAPSLDENMKTLLRKVFVKYPNLMNMHPDWWPEIIESCFKTLSSLLVMVTNTTPATMDDTTKRRMELLIGILEQYKLESTFIYDMRNVVSEAWKYRLEADNLYKEAEELRTKLQILDDKIERGVASIYFI